MDVSKKWQEVEGGFVSEDGEFMSDAEAAELEATYIDED